MSSSFFSACSSHISSKPFSSFSEGSAILQITTDLPLLLVIRNVLGLFADSASAIGTSRPSALVTIAPLCSPSSVNLQMLWDQRPTTSKLSSWMTNARQYLNEESAGIIEYAPEGEMQWMESKSQPVKYMFCLSSEQMYLAERFRVGIVSRRLPSISRVARWVPHVTTILSPTRVIPKHS